MPLQAPFSRRHTLLAHNAGIWEGTFIRLNPAGLEQERFASHLAVTDDHGVIEAALTNQTSGQVRAMRFEEPPEEMQISSAGHWSLGPNRIGPWPWVSELCLVWGAQRRRAVIRHNSTGLESLVVVIEGRPELSPFERAPAPSPLALTVQPQGSSQQCFFGADLAVVTQATRQDTTSAESVALRWQPAPRIQLEIQRHYGPAGLLEPLLG